MKRISFFGLALSVSGSMVACATPEEDPVVRDSGTTTGDSSVGDTPIGDSTPSDTPGDVKKDSTPPTDSTPEKCTAPLTDKRACGKCGTQSRICSADGTWGAWGACGGEDSSAECSIGEKRTADCGNCGKQNDICDNSTCTWTAGTCTGEGECAAGEIKVSTASCTVPGEVRTLVCSDKCKYPDTLSVPCAAPKGWVAMASVPTGFDGRFRHSAVWTGTEMIVWGGQGNSSGFGYGRNNGAAYNMTADTWRLINQSTIPSGLGSTNGRFDHTAVWTGSAMIVWGGINASTTLNSDGGSYNPTTDSWKAINGGPLAPRSLHTAVWATTTNEMIVWGGICSTSSSTACSDGAHYDPATDKWTAMPPSPIGGRYRHTMVWTGTELIIWGGQTAPTSGFLKDGARYDPKTRVWTKFPDPLSDIVARTLHTAVWSGKEMLVYGGWVGTSAGYSLNTGARYLPGGSWSSFTTPSDSDWSAGGGKRFWSHSWMAGGKLYMWSGGGTTSSTIPGGGTIYDPATDKWATLDATDAPTARAGASVVSTGKEAIVWGGTTTGITAYYWGLGGSGSSYFPGTSYPSGTWAADGKVYRP